MLRPTRRGAKNISLAVATIVCLLTFQFELANCVLQDPGYIQLDEILSGKCKVTDFNSNLLALRAEFNSIDSETTPALKDALEEVGPIAELPVDQPNRLRCDPNEYRTLVTSKSRADTQRYVTQLEIIIHHIRLIHAKECLPRYQGQFYSFYSTWLNNEGNNYAERFADLLTREPPGMTSQDYLTYLLDGILDEDVICQSVADRITEISETETTDSLYNVYIVGACERYQSYFRTFFEMVRSDEAMFQTSSLAYPNAESLLPYLKARAAFWTCGSILYKPELLKAKYLRMMTSGSSNNDYGWFDPTPSRRDFD